MSEPRRLWFTRGWHERRLLAYGGDEYGRKTLVLKVPFGGIVWAYRDFTYGEILDDMGGNWELADWSRNDFARNRRIDGYDPPLPGEPEFSQMTDDEVLDWLFPEQPQREESES